MGRFLQGEGMLDISVLTGELTPVPCTAGEQILASSLVIEGRLRLRVERLNEETQVMQEIRLAEQTPRHQTLISAYAEEAWGAVNFAQLGPVRNALSDHGRHQPIAGSLAVRSSHGHQHFCPHDRAFHNANCPAIGHLHPFRPRPGVAPEGRCGDFLQTGTLTLGKMTVIGVEAIGSIPVEEMMGLAAAVQRGFAAPDRRCHCPIHPQSGGCDPALPRLAIAP